MKIYIILSIIFCLGLLSCGDCEENTGCLFDNISKNEYYDYEIFDESYLDIYGDWKLYAVSGGFNGNGHELNFDFLVLKKYGIYGFLKNDNILEFGKIVIVEQTSETLLITLNPDENSDMFMLDSEKYINLIGEDTLNLNSPCCDRFNYHFERDK